MTECVGSHFVLKLVGQTLYSVWGLGGVFYLDVIFVAQNKNNSMLQVS